MKCELKLKWRTAPYDLTDTEGNEIRKFIFDNPPPWGNIPQAITALVLGPNGPDNPIPINAISSITMTNSKYTDEIIIDPAGKISCWRNGLLHRDDGPAIVCPNGRKEWYENGKRHREDGPALVSGTRRSWLRGMK